MDCFIRFIELTLMLNTEDFEKHLDRALHRSTKMYEIDTGYADESLMSKGVGVAFQNNSKRRKIRLIVYCPSLVIDGDEPSELWEPTADNVSKLIRKLDKLIVKYFQSGYGLGDFDLSRVDFAVDLDVGQEKVSEYIKVLQNIRQVMFFSPMKYGENDEESKDKCFGMTGKSGVEFRIYSLKHEKDTLRAEVRLMKKDTIRAYTDGYGIIEQIEAMAEGSEHIFMDSFSHIIPRGDFYKKQKVEKLIREKVTDYHMRAKMMRLLELIPSKKSLLLAQKSIDYRKVKGVMAAFAEIGVSPVTISKRHDIKNLDSLYSYLED